VGENTAVPFFATGGWTAATPYHCEGRNDTAISPDPEPHEWGLLRRFALRKDKFWSGRGLTGEIENC
jgi:hypothetical protein